MADTEPWFSIHSAGEAVFHSTVGVWHVQMVFDVVQYHPGTNRSAIVMAVWALATTGLAFLRFKSREI